MPSKFVLATLIALSCYSCVTSAAPVGGYAADVVAPVAPSVADVTAATNTIPGPPPTAPPQPVPSYHAGSDTPGHSLAMPPVLPQQQQPPLFPATGMFMAPPAPQPVAVLMPASVSFPLPMSVASPATAPMSLPPAAAPAYAAAPAPAAAPAYVAAPAPAAPIPSLTPVPVPAAPAPAPAPMPAIPASIPSPSPASPAPAPGAAYAAKPAVMPNENHPAAPASPLSPSTDTTVNTVNSGHPIFMSPVGAGTELTHSPSSGTPANGTPNPAGYQKPNAPPPSSPSVGGYSAANAPAQPQQLVQAKPPSATPAPVSDSEPPLLLIPGPNHLANAGKTILEALTKGDFQGILHELTNGAFGAAVNPLQPSAVASNSRQLAHQTPAKPVVSNERFVESKSIDDQQQAQQEAAPADIPADTSGNESAISQSIHEEVAKSAIVDSAEPMRTMPLVRRGQLPLDAATDALPVPASFVKSLPPLALKDLDLTKLPMDFINKIMDAFKGNGNKIPENYLTALQAIAGLLDSKPHSPR